MGKWEKGRLRVNGERVRRVGNKRGNRRRRSEEGNESRMGIMIKNNRKEKDEEKK